MLQFRFFIFLLLVALTSSACSWHRPPVETLPKRDLVSHKQLFIAFDGLAYEMMAQLKKEGYFKQFQEPIPLVVTFPSATTIGFTGIFKPLNVGKVPGYETRFYSYDQNKVVGGTPWDIHKYPVHYKNYFDSFRHTVPEKTLMYTMPGVAGRQDLERTEKLLLNSKKKILFTYLGGTDGAQHTLGKRRMREFMKFTDRFLQRMQKRYEKIHKEPLEIILFSDHGFHFDRLRMISSGDFKKALPEFNLNNRLDHENDILFVKYGLLSAGVAMTKSGQLKKIAEQTSKVNGIDLVFWPEKQKIYIRNEKEEAYFEYKDGTRRFRYISVYGDPLNYIPILKKAGLDSNAWLDANQWFNLTANAEYPDAGYRLWDGFYGLVQNKANLMFSLKPKYQFGAMSTLVSTKLRPGGHKGTHGGLFKSVSQGVVISTWHRSDFPKAMRYDQFFEYFLPQVTDAYRKQEIQVLVQPSAHSHAH